jgi:DNA-binding NarL/FixJ family response regulator
VEIGRWERDDARVSNPTVLIVDDHPGFREMARDLLSRRGFDVVGEAAAGQQALDEAARLGPQVVLLDVQLPDIDGFAVARLLLAEPDPPAVILTSTRDATDFGRRVRASGAIAFITKSALSADTLRAALRGRVEEEP